MTAKKQKVTINSLVGKPVMLVHRHGDSAEGPYTFLGMDTPFFGVYDLERNKAFWVNATLIDCIAEGESCETANTSSGN